MSFRYSISQFVFRIVFHRFGCCVEEKFIWTDDAYTSLVIWRGVAAERCLWPLCAKAAWVPFNGRKIERIFIKRLLDKNSRRKTRY